MNTQMDTMEKLRILSDAAKYDAACTSSGVNRAGVKGQLGSAAACGICHSFASDGRCISLLKVLMTNICAYDCTYCLNRRSNDTPRATFRPQELADLTISFYRRNYIEGLFLSSAVFGSPDITCERMLETLHILRNEYHFNGYIHVKAIPGADETLLQQLGLLADRMSVNIELPSNDSLKRLAPQKSKENILLPMSRIRDGIKENAHDLIRYKSAPRFVPGGRPTYFAAERRTLPQVFFKARVLLCVYTGRAGQKSARARHRAAASARAQALSGRLAFAVLRLHGGRIIERKNARPRPYVRPEVQLGGAPPGGIPCGGEPRAV